MSFLRRLIFLCGWFGGCLWGDLDQSLVSDRKYVRLKSAVVSELRESWCSREKIDLLMDLVFLQHPAICVEIGAFTGSSVLPVAAVLKLIGSGRIYAVDAWSNEEAIRDLPLDDPNRNWWAAVDMNWAKQQFAQLIRKWSLESRCVPIDCNSVDAIAEIPDGIDFLHLDGTHTENGVLRDVQLYLPKVKRGGYILLSNFHIRVDKKQTKMKGFCALCDACEIIASIENDNGILFQKN